jgi:hypothetical protein
VHLALGLTTFSDGRWPSAYDAAPFNGNPPQTNPAFANQVLASFRKYLEFLLHDGIHVWVGETWANNTNGGHMSFPAVAVNDPVFFLHHANVDRLWAIWQRKTPTPAYLPVAGANLGHNAGDTMSQFSDPGAFTLPLLAHPGDHQNHQAAGSWYYTDPPQVDLATPAVDFGNVPDQVTASAPVQFVIRTCQPVTLTATGVTGAHFALPPLQGPVTVGHQPGSDQQVVSLTVDFQAVGGSLGAVEQGSMTVEATYIDRDGYDASGPGAPVTLASFTINLSATPVAQPALAFAMQPGGTERDHFEGMSTMSHDHGDHENMAFKMLRLDPDGDVVEVKINRDTSEYDDEGNDVGTAPPAAAPESESGMRLA